MNTRYTTVNLDVSQQGSIPSITLSQYDLGVGLSFYIMDGGLPYSEFAETDTVVLSGTKPSGVGFTIPAYYKSENLCSFRTTQAMTTEAGTVTCEITITKVNNISVSTANFFVEVEASAHAHETVDEDIEDFGLIADQVGEYKATAVRAAQQAAQSATNAATSASSAEESMEAAQSAASSAIAAKDDIQEYIDDSEAWARGTRGGEAVPSTDETYENNAKYYAEQSSQASIDAGVSATEAAASAQEAAASVADAVKYTAQTLTDAQKVQARTNIGAASPSDIPSGTVRYDTSQSLTDAQKRQAKTNIGVPAIDATLAVTGAAADAKKVGDEISDLKGDLSECVLVTPQNLTEEQKEQVKENLSLGSGGDNLTLLAILSMFYDRMLLSGGIGSSLFKLIQQALDVTPINLPVYVGMGMVTSDDLAYNYGVISNRMITAPIMLDSHKPLTFKVLGASEAGLSFSIKPLYSENAISNTPLLPFPYDSGGIFIYGEKTYTVTDTINTPSLANVAFPMVCLVFANVNRSEELPVNSFDGQILINGKPYNPVFLTSEDYEYSLPVYVGKGIGDSYTPNDIVDNQARAISEIVYYGAYSGTVVKFIGSVANDLDYVVRYVVWNNNTQREETVVAGSWNYGDDAITLPSITFASGIEGRDICRIIFKHHSDATKKVDTISGKFTIGGAEYEIEEVR